MQCVHCKEAVSPVDLSPTNYWCQSCGTMMIGDATGTEVKYWHIPHRAQEWLVPIWVYILNCIIAFVTGAILFRGHH